MTIKELLQLETKQSAYNPPPTREAMMAVIRAHEVAKASKQEKSGASA